MSATHERSELGGLSELSSMLDAAEPGNAEQSAPPGGGAGRPRRAGRRSLPRPRRVLAAAGGAVGGALAGWNGRMLAAGESRSGTRWGRTVLAVLPAACAVAGIGQAMSQGALAAGFNVNAQPFTLTSNGVVGTGLGAILNTPNVESTTGTVTSTTGMARVGFSAAHLAGLCGIVHQTIAGLPYSLVLTAGQTVSSTPPATITTDITAADLYIQTASLAGQSTTLQNAVLGIAADQVLVDGQQLSGYQPGGFGLGYSGGSGGNSVTLSGLNASAYDAELAGSITLPGLNIQVVSGSATSC